MLKGQDEFLHREVACVPKAGNACLLTERTDTSLKVPGLDSLTARAEVQGFF